MSGWDRHYALLPYIPLLHLWAAASSEWACEVVTHFPTLARGLAWETHHTVTFWLTMSCLPSHHHHLCVFNYLVQTKCAFSHPLQAQVPILMHFKEKVAGYLMFSTCMLQDLLLTTTVNRPCDVKELLSHHFQFYAIALLHTIGSLMIFVSMQAREKRLSVQECKLPK